MMVVLTYTVASFAALAAIATAAPTQNLGPDHFTIEQAVKQFAYHPPSFHFANALRKHQMPVPYEVDTAVARALAVREEGTVPAIPDAYDYEFLSPVTIGNQTLTVDIDTGSADLWVFSSQLNGSSKAGHDVYTPGINAVELQHHTWKIRYGDGTRAGGNVYMDEVTVGGITAPFQAVEAAQWVSKRFVDDLINDGILGLSFNSINTVQPEKQLTFFDNIKEKLAQPLFASSLKHQAPGSYDFGYIDTDKYEGDIAWLPVDNSEGFWTVTFSGYETGGYENSTAITALVDTGTTFMFLPPEVVIQYYSNVHGSDNKTGEGGWVFPCDTTLPDFTFTVNDNYKAVVPGEHISYKPTKPGSPRCFGGIQATANDVGVFGGPLLKSQYVVYDSQGPRVGFAKPASAK